MAALRMPKDNSLDATKLKPHSKNSLNIAVVLFDSQSHSNAKRQFQSTYPYLLKDPNTFLFDGQSIVGDGTSPQLFAMLANLTEQDAEYARTLPGQKGTVDQRRFIFEDFKDAGYVTGFSEDDYMLGGFNWRYRGFKNPPTHKYMRPFWTKAYRTLIRTKNTCPHQYSLRYLRRFMEAFKDERKFIFLNNSPLGHFQNTLIGLADKDVREMYKYLEQKGFLENTVVIFFGDHGNRAGPYRQTWIGRLELRLPFLSITLPSWFKSLYPDFYENMLANTKVLTTYFDLYATLRHLMDLTSKSTEHGFGRSLFTKIEPWKRSCESAGVPDHYCPCLSYESQNITDTVVKSIAQKLVEFMNNQLLSVTEVANNCTHLTLKNIVKAGMRNLPKLRDSAARSFVYEHVIEVSPSGGLFEATSTVTMATDNKAIFSFRTERSSISRINMYRNQPDCIARTYPHFRDYCYCNELLT